jgi:hypothetical protein
LCPGLIAEFFRDFWGLLVNLKTNSTGTPVTCYLATDFDTSVTGDCRIDWKIQYICGGHERGFVPCSSWMWEWSVGLERGSAGREDTKAVVTGRLIMLFLIPRAAKQVRAGSWPALWD